MKGSDLLVAALENEGVDRIYAVPGEENLDVVESLRQSPIELIVTRHEQPAAFMAATYGRLTGKPGVALSTLGPGALNLVTGAAYGFLVECRWFSSPARRRFVKADRHISRLSMSSGRCARSRNSRSRL